MSHCTQCLVLLDRFLWHRFKPQMFNAMHSVKGFPVFQLIDNSESRVRLKRPGIVPGQKGKDVKIKPFFILQ
jgi:hypothetical protein